MLERLLQRDLLHLRERPGAERAAGGGEHDAAHVLAPTRAQGLKDRVVLGIDRQHDGACRGRASHEQRAGADQALLVGERDGGAALDRGERRSQTGRAGDRGHDPIGRPLRRLDDGRLASTGLDARTGQRILELAIADPDRRPPRSAPRVRARAAPDRRHYDWRSPPRPGSGQCSICKRSTVLVPIDPVAPNSVTERGSLTAGGCGRGWAGFIGSP